MDTHHRDVVILQRVIGKILNSREGRVDHVLGAFIQVVQDRLLEAADAERFALIVQCIGNAVGVENQIIAYLQIDFLLLEMNFLEAA